MKIPLYIAIYALLITLSSTKSNSSSSNKTPGKKVIQNFGISICEILVHCNDRIIKSTCMTLFLMRDFAIITWGGGGGGGGGGWGGGGLRNG